MTPTIPSANGDVTIGDVLTTSKTYTAEEIREFRRLGGQAGGPSPTRHLPYLLTISPLTKLGGDINYLAGRMTWTATRPVGVTETLDAELEITGLKPVEGGTQVALAARVRCGGEIVVNGRGEGIVLSG